MNATCKRLLSWLIVATMVLSMAPVLDLSNFAVTTKAAENPAQDTLTAIESMEETFAGATETVTAVCPVCARMDMEVDMEGPIEEAVEWLPVSGTDLETLSFAKEDNKIAHYHYYLSGDASFTGKAITFTNGNNHRFCLNLNGKTLTTGDTMFSTNYGNTLNVMDSASGGNVIGKFAGAGAAVFNTSNPNVKINIYGGTFKRTADSNIYSTLAIVAGGAFNLYDGVLDGTGVSNTSYATTLIAKEYDATRGAAVNMYGGKIKCGTTTGDGNVQLEGNATFNLYDGTITGGVARGGGAFNVNAGTLNVNGGTISGGQAGSNSNATVSGGNIILTNGGTFEMTDGVLCGGNATKAHGGNIQIRRDQVGHINISGGKIYGGTAANGNGANIYAYSTATGSTMTIGGSAEIAGGIYAGENVTTTLTGTPKILASGLTDAQGNPVSCEKGLEVNGKSNLDVAGLVEGAQIQVTGAKDAVFSAACENADTVAEFFKSLTDGTEIAVADNQLKIVGETMKNDVFEPWKFEGQAYCPVCQKVETWTAIDSAAAVDGKVLTGHQYLSTDITNDTLARFVEIGNGNLCFNLNGKTLTMNKGRAFQVNRAYTLNIMDTEGTGVVTGFAKGNSGAVIHMNATSNSVNDTATVNIYGGTFKKTIGEIGVDAVSGGTDSRRSAIIYLDSYGTITMYGGTIDAAELNTPDTQNQIYPLAVLLRGGADKAIFDMRGGTIIGGNSTGDGGLIRVGMPGSSNKNVAAFKMSGGTIYGGGVFTDARGGNIYVENENAVEISGGVIVGDIYATKGAAVKLVGDAKIVKALTVGEQTVLAKRTGLHIASEDVTVDVSELTTGAEIYIEGALDTALITAENAEELKDCVKAFEGTQYAYVKDNAFYLAQATAAVVTDVETGYATAADALAAYYADPTGYVKLLADATVELSGNALIDANGYTVLVNGTGKLYAMDSSNDDYDGCGMWIVIGEVEVVKDVVNPVNGNRYILIKNEDETYGAHRIEMDLTHVTLSTANAGLYFKSEYKCDDVLAAHVGDYGVVLSVDGGAEIASTMEAAFAPNEEHAVTGASTEVYGIFKNEGRTNEENTAIGETVIKATPYITVDGKEIGGNTNVQMSLLDVMVKIDNAWENASGYVPTEEEKAQAQAFYATWKDLGMSAWAEKLPNISAEA